MMKACNVKILNSICCSNSLLTKELPNIKHRNFNFKDLHNVIYYKTNLIYNSYLNIYISEEQPINTAPICLKQKLDVDNIILPIPFDYSSQKELKTITAVINMFFSKNYYNSPSIIKFDNHQYCGWKGCIFDVTNNKVLLLITQRIHPIVSKVDFIFNFDKSIFIEKTKMNTFLKNLYLDISNTLWNDSCYCFFGIKGNKEAQVSAYANMWENIPNIGYQYNVNYQMKLNDNNVRLDCINKVNLMLETLLP